ncbi:MAG: bacterial Ig-like domain-containing protein [Paludibacteraceae bacterium]|nr:bacterial Ig-like domain-containing protein [Paludibacteraceae bacterium]
MKKLTLLLSVMLLACTTSLWATEAIWTWTAANGDLGTTTPASVTLNEKAWTVTSSATSRYTGIMNGYIQLGKKDAAETITLTSSAFEGTIKSVVVNCASYNASHTISIKVGETEYYKAAATPKWSNNAGGNVKGEGSASGDITITFTAGSSARAMYIKSITVVTDDGSSATISGLTIEGTPNKTAYMIGDAFDKTGLSVKATYSDESVVDVTDVVSWTINPQKIAENTTSVEVKAAYQGKEATTTVNVTVLSLQALALSGEPKNMTYYLGETFNPDGLVVTGTYSDGTTTADVTDKVSWKIDPATFTTLGTVSVDVMAFIGDDLMSNVLTINNVQVVDVDKYAKITSAKQLADGQHIIIVDKDTTSALSTTQNTNNRGAVSVKASASGLINPSSSVEIITLNTVDTMPSRWELQTSTGGYLYAASSSNNYIRTQTTNTTNGQWTITIAAETGIATVKAQGTNTNNVLKKNNSSALFSCYNGGQKDIAIFARQYTVTVNSNDESMGTVTGSGNYFENNVATLVATPKEGYKFTGWSNNAELSSATQDLTVTANITITANFAKGETAIESAAVETPALKTIENGQLVIIRDGVKYNAMGVRL